MSDSNPDYLEELKELREILRLFLNKGFLQDCVEIAEAIDKSYIDSYCRIKETSSQGENCGYARKAKDLFMKFQEHNISTKIENIYKNYIYNKK